MCDSIVVVEWLEYTAPDLLQSALATLMGLIMTDSPRPRDSLPSGRLSATARAWFVVALLFQGFFALSQQFQWFAFNKQSEVALAITLAGTAGLFGLLTVALIATRLVKGHVSFDRHMALLAVATLAIPLVWSVRDVVSLRQKLALIEKSQFVGYGAGKQEAPQTKPLSSTERAESVLNEGVTFLSLPNASDADIENLRELPQLTGLSLVGWPATEAGLKNIAKLERLTSLDLNQTQLTDAQLDLLAGLKNLDTLMLGETKLTDDGCRRLQAFKKLERLRLAGTQISDHGLSYLKDIQTLVALDVGATRITDRGMDHVGQLKQLTVLHLSRTKVSDAGIARLSGLVGIKTFWLEEASISDGALETLGKLPHLANLNVSYTNVTDAGLKHLLGNKALEQVDLRGTKVTWQAVLSFRKQTDGKVYVLDSADRSLGAASMEGTSSQAISLGPRRGPPRYGAGRPALFKKDSLQPDPNLRHDFPHPVEPPDPSRAPREQEPSADSR